MICRSIALFACLIAWPLLLASHVRAGQDEASAVAAKAGGKSRTPHLIAKSVPPWDPAGTAQYGLTRRDLEAIIHALPHLQLAVPVREIRRPARYGEQVADAQLIGTTPEYAELHDRPIARGRFLVSDDVRLVRNVAVIGSQLARTLFRDQEPVGKNLRVGDHYFLVVGTIEAPHGPVQADRNEDAGMHLYIPLSTMRSRLGDRELVRRGGTRSVRHFELSRIEILLTNFAMTSPSLAIVRKLLDALHEDTSFQVMTFLDHERGDGDE